MGDRLPSHGRQGSTVLPTHAGEISHPAVELGGEVHQRGARQSPPPFFAADSVQRSPVANWSSRSVRRIQAGMKR